MIHFPTPHPIAYSLLMIPVLMLAIDAMLSRIGILLALRLSISTLERRTRYQRVKLPLRRIVRRPFTR